MKLYSNSYLSVVAGTSDSEIITQSQGPKVWPLSGGQTAGSDYNAKMGSVEEEEEKVEAEKE